MIITIKNPLGTKDTYALSKLSLAQLEQELDEIMEVSGFIIPPRAAALQNEIAQRRNSKINLASLYGKTANGGFKRSEFYTLSAKTGAGKSSFELDRLLLQTFKQEEAEINALFAKPIRSFSQQRIEDYVTDRLATMDPLMKYKSNYYNPSPLDKLSADMEGFDGSATDWFNEQYLQTATKPQPQMVRKTVDYLGLLEPPRGIDPVDLEIGREKNLAYMRQYVKSMEDAMKSLKESIADIKPAFITAKAPSAEDIRKVRDYIFDDSIKFMYPTTIQPLDTMIGISTPVAANAVLDVEMPKKRDVFYVDVLKGV